MKASIFYLSLIMEIFLFSCDYVEIPQQSVAPDAGSNDSNQVKRKILVEDYTGHTCGNCPAAAQALKQILDQSYGDQVVPVAVHAGFFAMPQSAPYTADYRNPISNDYDGFFGISAAGNPNGMVNRMGYTNNSHIKSYSSWGALVAGLVNNPPDIAIDITNTFDDNTQLLSISISTKFLNTMSGTYKLVVLLTQDSVISAQKDYSQTPSDILNYVHRHILRDAINSSWGDSVATGTINAGTLVARNFVYNGLATHPTWDPDHCYVVTYIYDASTLEVIQAEERKLKQ